MTIMINIMLHLFSVLFELSEFPSINEESVDVLNKETVVYVSAIELNICGAWIMDESWLGYFPSLS